MTTTKRPANKGSKRGRTKPITEREQMQSARMAVKYAVEFGFKRGYRVALKRFAPPALVEHLGEDGLCELPLDIQIAFNFDLDEFADAILTQVHALTVRKRGISPLRDDLLSDESRRKRKSRSKKATPNSY